jgi:hypothetical protein
MSATPTQPTDLPEENEPDTVATPEGDNEYAPEQPLSPAAPTPERLRGDDPHTNEPLYPALD